MMRIPLKLGEPAHSDLGEALRLLARESGETERLLLAVGEYGVVLQDLLNAYYDLEREIVDLIDEWERTPW